MNDNDLTVPDDVDLANHTRREIAFRAAEIITAADGPSDDKLAAAIGKLSIGDFRRMAYTLIEFRDALLELHAMVMQTDPNDPIGIALTKVGLIHPPTETR